MMDTMVGIKSMVLSHIPTLGIMESTPPTTNQDTMGQETSLENTPLWSTTDSNVLRYFGYCSVPLWSTTYRSVVLPQIH